MTSSLYMKSKSFPMIVKSKEFKDHRLDSEYCAECSSKFFRLETIHKTVAGDWVCGVCAELRDQDA